MHIYFEGAFLRLTRSILRSGQHCSAGQLGSQLSSKTSVDRVVLMADHCGRAHARTGDRIQICFERNHSASTQMGNPLAK